MIPGMSRFFPRKRAHSLGVSSRMFVIAVFIVSVRRGPTDEPEEGCNFPLSISGDLFGSLAVEKVSDSEVMMVTYNGVRTAVVSSRTRVVFEFRLMTPSMDVFEFMPFATFQRVHRVRGVHLLPVPTAMHEVQLTSGERCHCVVRPCHCEHRRRCGPCGRF